MNTNRYDLTRSAGVKSFLLNRWPQFLLRAITLAGFTFTILSGLFGSAVGSHNFAIIFVWIAWWTALKLFFIPFGGRSWCAICPIPMPGEWLQNKGILQPRGKKIFGLNKPWPKFLRGNWLQAFGFLLVGLFSALTLTSAKITAIALLGIILLALGLSLVFERRAFCNYLCPIGGFTGLYAQAGPVEVRVKDKSVCVAHSEKVCYDACPWGQYPLALKSSANCGLCMECLRVCPSDNLAVNLRPWGSDLSLDSKHNLSETFLGLVMLATVLVDSAVFLGPWGNLKIAAYTIGSTEWFTFAGLYLPFTLILIPGLYGITVFITMKITQTGQTIKQALAHYGQALVPLGLMAWIAFTVSFAFVKFGFVLPVVSDPMGWGWNLLGLRGPAGIGQSSFLIQAVQVIILGLGLLWAGRIALKISRSTREALPLILFSSSFSISILWLLIG
jgi:polyferredoxin